MNRVAVVTGARRGIGLAIAKKLAVNGYFVLLTAVTPRAQTQELLAELQGAGMQCDYAQCDIARQEDIAALFQQVERYGRLDVLVNNAGVAPLQRMDVLETTRESFDRVLDINLRGTFFMCQAAANYLLTHPQTADGVAPRIINISSMSAYTSSTTRGEYCISKAGIAMVTKLFADRLAEDGIPVFEVRPGIIMTDMTSAVQDKYDRMIAQGVTPIRRMGQPEDVANCVLAACSGLLDFGTGTILNADGGFHMQRL